jgi:TolB-like protein/Flp pilus assembly protein TadD
MSENNGLEGPQGKASPSAEAILDAHSFRDVFVSYASQDSELASSVVLALERNGLTCWIASRDVVPGDLYADGIIRAITASKVFVLVLSKSATASSHVGKEVERASSKHRPIVALRIDTTPLTPALEYFLSESQWIDLKGGQTEAALTQIVEAVRRHRGGAEAVKPSVSLDPAKRTKIRAWMPLAALAGLLLVVVAYFVVPKFRGSAPGEQGRPVAATVPAVQVLGPAAPIISEKSVAVLPFVDMSEKKDQEYFSDGLSEELINMLAKVPDLRVPARTSSFYFKGKSEDIPTIAKRLLVAHVLEGSVRKSGNHMRITVQLVRADNGYHLWSETYDRNVDDIFKVQDEIAGAVVKALKISLLETRGLRSAPTVSSEAYTLFLQGRSIYQRGSSAEDMEKATVYLHRALDLDPSFALAWAELSLVHLYQVWEYPFKGASDRARDAAARAVALNPNLADAHVALGRIRATLDWDWAGADMEFQHALKLDPANPIVLRAAADIPLIFGEYDKTTALYEQSKAQDPLDSATYTQLGWMYFYAGKLAESEAAYREAFDINPATAGSLGGAHWEFAVILLARGQRAAALLEMQREPSRTRANLGLAMVNYAMGQTAESDSAIAAAEREFAQQPVSKFSDSGAAYIACAHAYRGNVDQALAWLDRAYERRDFGLVYLNGSPLLNNLKNDQRYKAFLRKMNLSE